MAAEANYTSVLSSDLILDTARRQAAIDTLVAPRPGRAAQPALVTRRVGRYRPIQTAPIPARSHIRATSVSRPPRPRASSTTPSRTRRPGGASVGWKAAMAQIVRRRLRGTGRSQATG